jgi:hypothetical protein
MGPAGFEPATNQVKYIDRPLPSGTFPTSPSRTVRATFIAHGSPTPTFHLAGDASFNAHVRFSDFVVCIPSPRRVELRSSVLHFCLDMLGFGYDNLGIKGVGSLNGCHY